MAFESSDFSVQEPEFEHFDDTSGSEYTFEKESTKDNIFTRTLHRVHKSQVFYKLNNNVKSLTTHCKNVISTIDFQLEEEWKGIFTKLIILWLICVLLWFYFFKINHTKLF